MGGRGASSGFSKNRHTGKIMPYGSEYRSLLKVGNIKFIEATSHESELLETRTRGRVYVTIDHGKLESIHYFDNNLKRYKTIDLNHKHVTMMPHVHHGYYHRENDGKKGATLLNPDEKKMVDRVTEIWHNYVTGHSEGGSTR